MVSEQLLHRYAIEQLRKTQPLAVAEYEHILSNVREHVLDYDTGKARIIDRTCSLLCSELGAASETLYAKLVKSYLTTVSVLLATFPEMACRRELISLYDEWQAVASEESIYVDSMRQAIQQ